jgi:hypothetical protein
MKYATPEAFRAALDQRIRNEAIASGVTVMRLRKRVAFERFLARLAIVNPQRWVLKGAFVLDLRLGLRTRTTKDIDLAGVEDEQTVTPDLIAAQAIDLHDHFSEDSWALMQVLAGALEFADEDISETACSMVEHTEPQALAPERDTDTERVGVLCDFMETAQVRIDALAVREDEGTVLDLAA